MEGELRKIKKLYGEDFAKLCRVHFSRLLDEEGKLTEILLKLFAPSHSLYDELMRQDRIFEFKGAVYKKAGISKPEKIEVDETPEELLKKCGYKLYRCKTDREVKSFRKYYAPDEVLCTFRDPRRIKTNDIFFAVHEDAEQLQRESFKNPQREDRYGVSVMSFQFLKEDGSLSIKNRYNHAVDNPDATYCNDLESIIPGLTESFAKYYGLDSRVDYSRYPELYLAHFVKDKNGVAYRYNAIIKGVYFCENNIIVKDDGTAVQYDKSRYELIGTLLIDKSQKTMKDLSGGGEVFANLFVDVDKIDVEKAEQGTRKIIVTKQDGTYFVVTVDETNSMIGYENKFQTEVEDNFLHTNMTLREVSLPNVKKIGNHFMRCNTNLKIIDFPELEEVGDEFLKQSSKLNVVSLPSLKKTGEYFLFNATSLKSIELPKLEEASHVFMAYASGLQFVDMPNLKKLGESAFRQCVNLKSIDLSALEEVDAMFLRENQRLEYAYLPALRVVGDEFMFANRKLRTIELPSAEYIGDRFMPYNEVMSQVKLPVARTIGSKFLNRNLALREIDLPEVKSIGASFLYTNQRLKTFTAPKLNNIGSCSLFSNKAMSSMSLPEAEYLGEWTLHKNRRMKTLDIPKARSIGRCFLTERGKLKKIRVSNRVVLPAYLKAHTIEETNFDETDLINFIGIEPEN